MDQLLSLAALLVFLFLGMAIHWLRLTPKPAMIEMLAAWTLYALLASMGLRLGQNREIAILLPKIGFLAISTAAATSIGTISVLWALSPVLRSYRAAILLGKTVMNSGQPAPLPASGLFATSPAATIILHLRGPFRLLVVVIISFVAGLFLPPNEILASGILATWILYALLVLIGMQMAANRINWAVVLLKPATLAVPFGTAVGSLLGAAILCPFFNLTLGKAFSLGAGFGWYSLSGVLLTDLGDPVLGSTAFLANLFRESLALITIPWLSALERPELAIGIGGATSMDVTLPLIERCNGPAVVPLSLAHGLILSFLVPVLVPVLYNLP